jgi:hypothetical protein
MKGPPILWHWHEYIFFSVQKPRAARSSLVSFARAPFLDLFALEGIEGFDAVVNDDQVLVKANLSVALGTTYPGVSIFLVLHDATRKNADAATVSFQQLETIDEQLHDAL